MREKKSKIGMMSMSEKVSISESKSNSNMRSNDEKWMLLESIAMMIATGTATMTMIM